MGKEQQVAMVSRGTVGEYTEEERGDEFITQR